MYMSIDMHIYICRYVHIYMYVYTHMPTPIYEYWLLSLTRTFHTTSFFNRLSPSGLGCVEVEF